MFHYLTLLFIVIVSASADEENCDAKGILVYEDLGCKPVIESSKSPCPVKFECDDFKREQDSCLFQSRKFNIGETVDNNITYGSCNVGCGCVNNTHVDSNKADFRCAVLDCPNFFRQNKPDCYEQYKLNSCCSEGVKCPPFEDVEKCAVGDKEYKEGQRFNPENTCLECVCQKGFKGKFEAPFCQKSTCGVQLRNSEKLENSCAPIYMLRNDKEVLCCPSDWLCPVTEDKFKKINPHAPENSELSCKFGNNVLKLGEGFEKKLEIFSSERDIKCECITPPLLSCTGKY